MREILFKAKRKDNGKWIEGYLFKIWEETYILWGTTNGVPNMVEVDPDTVCQYTGLTDKNGKNIFEGDIVKCEAYDGQIIKSGIISYSGCDYIIEYSEGSAKGFYYLHHILMHNLEAIGNIYDNPELLKEVE